MKNTIKVLTIVLAMMLVFACSKEEKPTATTQPETVTTEKTETVKEEKAKTVVTEEQSAKKKKITEDEEFEAELAKAGLSKEMNALKLFNMMLDKKSECFLGIKYDTKNNELIIHGYPNEIELNPANSWYLLPGLKYKSVVMKKCMPKSTIEDLMESQGGDAGGPFHLYTLADIDRDFIKDYVFYSKLGTELITMGEGPFKNNAYIHCYDNNGKKIAHGVLLYYDPNLIPFSKEFFDIMENETVILEKSTSNNYEDYIEELKNNDKEGRFLILDINELQELQRKNRQIFYSYDSSKDNKRRAFNYDESGLLTGSEIDGTITTTYTRDENGNIHERIHPGDDFPSVIFTKYDEKGNWIEREFYDDGVLWATYKRTIEYYE